MASTDVGQGFLCDGGVALLVVLKASPGPATHATGLRKARRSLHKVHLVSETKEEWLMEAS